MSRAGARTEVLGEQLLVPLDRARAAFNRVVLATPLGAGLARKDTRVAARAVVGITVAFALALWAPLLLFAVAPIVLGVPHLAADVRYLVLAPRYGRAMRALLVLGCVPFVVLRLLPLVGVRLAGEAALEMELALGALGLAGVLAALSARRPARLLVLLPLLAVAAPFVYRHADGVRIAFAHAHNLVALVVWAMLFRGVGRARTVLWPLGLAVGAAGLLFALGVASPALGAQQAFGLSLAQIASWLAPGVPLRAGVAIVVTYVFLQSVHYSVWLGLIPTDAVRGDASRSFRMSLRALVRDFGAPGLAVIVLLTVGILGAATRDLNQTREAYLTLSAFHGYLELAVLAIALCGRRDLWKARQAS